MGLFNRTRKGLGDAYIQRTSVYGTLSSPPTLHLGYSSTLPAADGSNITEPSTGSYARVTTVMPTDWATFTDADPSVSLNATLFTFPAPTADWLSGALLPYVVAFDASSGGNAEFWGEVANPRSVFNGDAAPTIPIGEAAVELEDE